MNPPPSASRIFLVPSAKVPAAPFHPPALIRLGTLDARGCHLKFYVPRTQAAGLRPEDLAAARRAVRAVLAEPGEETVAGFAMLSGLHDGDLPAGGLVLTACRWEGAVLQRHALLLPVADEPVRRLPDHGLRLPELQLAVREGQAWERHVACPTSLALAAYLGEDCS